MQTLRTKGSHAMGVSKKRERIVKVGCSEWLETNREVEFEDGVGGKEV